MGCALAVDAQQSVRVGHAKPTQRTRTERKNLKIHARMGSQPDKMYESVTMIRTDQFHQIDEMKTMEVLKNHFFFYNMSNAERAEVISRMVPCRAEAGTYLFRQGDNASAFFIIDQGLVQVEINGHSTKQLRAGDYFGELALIYTAPRSASIKVVRPTTFWCITRSAFRQTVEEFVKRNYTMAKQYLKNVSLLGFLSQKQKDSLAYNMHSLKYEDKQAIYKLNDDANALYIVTEGTVEIGQGEKKVVYKAGEYFGEDALEDGNKRLSSAISKGKSICISIGRDAIKNILGDKISNILVYNVMKTALETSKILSKLSRVEMEKLLQSCRLKSFDHGEVVFRKNDQPHFVAICLEGKLGGFGDRELVGEEYLAPNHPPKITADIVKEGTGLIGLITFEEITKVSKLRISELSNIAHEARYEKRMQTVRVLQPHNNLRLQNFQMLRKLGQGQFGKVYLVRQSSTAPRVYAMKCISKSQVVENKMERIILQEKRILSMIDCPMMLQFIRSFRDEHFIYLLMEYIRGSELFDVIRQIGFTVPRNVARFYVSSVLMSLEYLHMKNIIYRDLKPQNIMVENNGYLRLIDMGTAKQLTQSKGFRTFTIIGTPHYMAPEVMLGKGYTFAVDLWSLGIMLYQFVCGQLPFAEKLEDPYDIHSVIMRSQLKYPPFFQDDKAKRMIEQFLNRVPELRLPKGFSALKASPYFDGFAWQELYDRTMKCPYQPKTQVQELAKDARATPLKDILLAELPQTTGMTSQLPNWDQEF